VRIGDSIKSFKIVKLGPSSDLCNQTKSELESQVSQYICSTLPDLSVTELPIQHHLTIVHAHYTWHQDASQLVYNIANSDSLLSLDPDKIDAPFPFFADQYALIRKIPLRGSICSHS
jgi:hypothetical protein